MQITKDEIEAARSTAGGWSRETLAHWGVAWPPPKGWKSALQLGLPIPGGAVKHRPVWKKVQGQRQPVNCICGTWPCTEYQAIARAHRPAGKRNSKTPQLKRPVNFQQSRQEYATNKRRVEAS